MHRLAILKTVNWMVLLFKCPLLGFPLYLLMLAQQIQYFSIHWGASLEFKMLKSWINSDEYRFPPFEYEHVWILELYC